MYSPLPASFYQQETVRLAQELLGKVLVHETIEGLTAGIVVETEAYLHPNDPAAHTFRGQSERNKAMFGPAGHAYIYFTFGMHYCMNIVTPKPGEGILIRALEPVAGIKLMHQRRLGDKVITNQESMKRNLCSGPGKLVQAMGITMNLYGHDLTAPPLYISQIPEKTFTQNEIVKTTRVGITQGADLPLRFYLKGNPFVSKK